MKQFIFFPPMALMVLFLTACATTRVSEHTALDSKGEYRSMVIAAPGADSEIAEPLKVELVKALRKRGVVVSRYESIFPDKPRFDAESDSKFLLGQGVDGLLEVELACCERFETGGVVSAMAKVSLYDMKTAQVTWHGKASTRAAGLLYMRESKALESLAEAIAEKLVEERYIKP